MATAIIMPKAGMAMESGTIVAWLKKVGDPVTVGEAILEIETDKVVMEVEAEVSGVILAITHNEGDEVPVTETIGYVGEVGESIAELTDQPPISGGQPASVTTPAPAREPSSPAPEATAPSTPDPTKSHDRPATAQHPARDVSPEDLQSKPPAASGPASPRSHTNARGVVRATPAARRIAGENDLPLARIHPTGRAGEVTAADVVSAAQTAEASQAPPASGATVAGGSAVSGSEPPVPASGGTARGATAAAGAPSVGRREALSPMRRAIAAAMTLSARIPQFTLHADAPVDSLFAFRDDLERSSGCRAGLTTFIVRALALAFAEMPAMAARFDDDAVLHPEAIGVGIAVSVPGGIVVPVVRDPAGVTIGNLDATIWALVEKGRGGHLTQSDLSGAVTTVSNLGAFGVTWFTPMLTPPQSSVLGVSAVRDEPVVAGDRISVRRVLGLDITVDHRVNDGAQAAAFLQLVIGKLAEPTLLT